MPFARAGMSKGVRASADRSPSPQYAFIIGTGRCGSSLVHEVVARHDDVGFLSNVEDRFPWMPALGAVSQPLYRRLPPSATTKGRVRLAPSEGYHVLDHQVSPVLSMPPRDLTREDATPWLAERVSRFFNQRATAPVRPLFVHKFTGWPRAGFLDAALPGSKFIHVVRDGRAVAASWLKMPWWRGDLGPDRWHFGRLPAHYSDEWERSDRSPVVLAGLAWKLLLDAHDEARVALDPGQWLEVRYEDVVADPRQAFATVLTFLGLEWTPRFDRQFRRHSFSVGPTDAYRRDFDTETLAALETSLATHLHQRGYRTGAALRVVP